MRYKIYPQRIDNELSQLDSRPNSTILILLNSKREWKPNESVCLENVSTFHHREQRRPLISVHKAILSLMQKVFTFLNNTKKKKKSFEQYMYLIWIWMVYIRHVMTDEKAQQAKKVWMLRDSLVTQKLTMEKINPL